MSRAVGLGLFAAVFVLAAIGHAVGMRWGRALLFVGWAFAGWHFFVR